MHDELAKMSMSRGPDSLTKAEDDDVDTNDDALAVSDTCQCCAYRVGSQSLQGSAPYWALSSRADRSRRWHVHQLLEAEAAPYEAFQFVDRDRTEVKRTS